MTRAQAQKVLLRHKEIIERYKKISPNKNKKKERKEYRDPQFELNLDF